mmetsp:Transcript_110835/g.320339  ORF Transcript_110835/g.320339 Transcript_110835/m.320339 type:complete len:173 (-) Transcript_110835:102-620(-)
MASFRQCSISARALLLGVVAASWTIVGDGLVVKSAGVMDLASQVQPMTLSSPFAVPAPTSNMTAAEAKAAAEKAAFVANCTTHIKGLIAEIDRHYTDVQLETTLLSYCLASKEHPAAYADGFRAHLACAEFASKLHAIRDQELKGKKADYGAFCAEAYDYRALPRKTTTVSR